MTLALSSLRRQPTGSPLRPRPLPTPVGESVFAFVAWRYLLLIGIFFPILVLFRPIARKIECLTGTDSQNRRQIVRFQPGQWPHDTADTVPVPQTGYRLTSAQPEPKTGPELAPKTRPEPRTGPKQSLNWHLYQRIAACQIDNRCCPMYTGLQTPATETVRHTRPPMELRRVQKNPGRWSVKSIPCEITWSVGLWHTRLVWLRWCRAILNDGQY